MLQFDPQITQSTQILRNLRTLWITLTGS